MANNKEHNKTTPSETTSPKTLEKRQFTEEEKTRIENYKQRLQKKAVTFKSEKSRAGSVSVSFVNPDDQLLCVKNV
jgi:hypothetical protein